MLQIIGFPYFYYVLAYIGIIRQSALSNAPKGISFLYIYYFPGYIVGGIAIIVEHQQLGSIGSRVGGALAEATQRVVAIAGDQCSDVGSVGLAVDVGVPVVGGRYANVGTGDGAATKVDAGVDCSVGAGGGAVPVQHGPGDSTRDTTDHQGARAAAAHGANAKGGEIGIVDDEILRQR